MAELTTLERLQHWKAHSFDQVGLQYTAELIYNAAIELEKAEAKLESLEYRHAALIEIYSHENCMNIESVEKRIDVFINEEQSHS